MTMLLYRKTYGKYLLFKYLYEHRVTLRVPKIVMKMGTRGPHFHGIPKFYDTRTASHVHKQLRMRII